MARESDRESGEKTPSFMKHEYRAGLRGFGMMWTES